MMPGVNPRQMRQAMQRMGIQQQEIEATQVVIRTPTQDIVIDNPSVLKVNMMGQKSYQISGEEKVMARQTKVEISEEDITTVMEQANVSRDEALAAIEDADGDLAEAIMSLSKEG